MGASFKLSIGLSHLISCPRSTQPMLVMLALPNIFASRFASSHLVFPCQSVLGQKIKCEIRVKTKKLSCFCFASVAKLNVYVRSDSDFLFCVCRAFLCIHHRRKRPHCGNERGRCHPRRRWL